tara:strand:+ start:672 stop:860 length:189 start_codon:yes stop_codon:yes gene_type:complete
MALITIVEHVANAVGHGWLHQVRGWQTREDLSAAPAPILTMTVLKQLLTGSMKGKSAKQVTV